MGITVIVCFPVLVLIIDHCLDQYLSTFIDIINDMRMGFVSVTIDIDLDGLVERYVLGKEMNCRMIHILDSSRQESIYSIGNDSIVNEDREMELESRIK